MSRFFLAFVFCLALAGELRAENHVWWTAQPLSGAAGVISQGSPDSPLELSYDDQQVCSWLITAIYQVATNGARSWSLDYWTYAPGSTPSDEYFPPNDLNAYTTGGSLVGGAGYFIHDSAGSTLATVSAGTYQLHQFKWTVPVGFVEATVYGAIGEIGFVGNDTVAGYENVALAGNTAREGKVNTGPNGQPIFEPVPIINLHLTPEPSTALLLLPAIMLLRRRR